MTERGSDWELDKAHLDELSIAELDGKRMLADVLIRVLVQSDDPRAPGQLERLRADQRLVNEVLVRKLRQAREASGVPEPPAQTVGMGPAQLFGRALKPGQET